MNGYQSGVGGKEHLGDYALRELTRLIINCEIEPGTVVSEPELAGKLGVSRTPIRRAIAELFKTGILEVFPQRGCKISLIDYAPIQESIFVRTVIETAIFKEVCAKASSEDLRFLENNLQIQRHYLDNKDHSRLLSYDDEFHRLIFNIAGKMKTYEFINSMSIHFKRLRMLGLATIKNIKIIEDHRSILEAIKSGDVQSGEKIISKHIGGRSRLNEPEIRKMHPTYFAPQGKNPTAFSEFS